MGGFCHVLLVLRLFDKLVDIHTCARAQHALRQRRKRCQQNVLPAPQRHRRHHIQQAEQHPKDAQQQRNRIVIEVCTLL